MIFKFIGGVFIFLLIPIIIGFVLLINLFSSFTSKNRRSTFTEPNSARQAKRKSSGKEENITELFDKETRKKLFNKDEGEYVDFEEVKD